MLECELEWAKLLHAYTRHLFVGILRSVESFQCKLVQFTQIVTIKVCCCRVAALGLSVFTEKP